MNPDPASLDNLQDIIEMAPVSWWPFATGWWFVIVISLIGLLIQTYLSWRKWQSNAYRREALRLLQTTSSVAEISSLLKRTALSAGRRSDIASLTGPDWIAWLTQTSKGLSCPADVQELLTTGVYEKTQHPNQLSAVKRFAKGWILIHRLADKDPVSC